MGDFLCKRFFSCSTRSLLHFEIEIRGCARVYGEEINSKSLHEDYFSTPLLLSAQTDCL